MAHGDAKTSSLDHLEIVPVVADGDRLLDRGSQGFDHGAECSALGHLRWKDLQVHGLRLNGVHREACLPDRSLQRLDPHAGTDDQELVRVLVQQGIEGGHDLVAQAIIDRVGVRQWMLPLRVHPVPGVEQGLHLGNAARQGERPVRRQPRQASLVQRVPGREVQHLPPVVEDRRGIGAEGSHPGRGGSPHPPRRHAHSDATGLGSRHGFPHARSDAVHARADRPVQVDDEQPVVHG